jgi:hypothetical protein
MHRSSRGPYTQTEIMTRIRDLWWDNIPVGPWYEHTRPLREGVGRQMVPDFLHPIRTDLMQ